MEEINGQCRFDTVQDSETNDKQELKLSSDKVRFKSYSSNHAIQVVKDQETKNVYMLEGELHKMPEISEDALGTGGEDFKILLKRISDFYEDGIEMRCANSNNQQNDGMEDEN